MGKFYLKRYEADVIFFKERIESMINEKFKYTNWKRCPRCHEQRGCAGPLFWGTQAEQDGLAVFKNRG
jgi:hypothetical protein